MFRLASEEASMTNEEEDRTSGTSHNCKNLPSSILNIYSLSPLVRTKFHSSGHQPLNSKMYTPWLHPESGFLFRTHKNKQRVAPCQNKRSTLKRRNSPGSGASANRAAGGQAPCFDAQSAKAAKIGSPRSSWRMASPCNATSKPRKKPWKR